MQPFQVIAPSSDRVPIVFSVPHCGIGFPEEIKSEYKQPLTQAPDDTDQHVLQLEMTKVNYMDDAEKKYNPERANKMRKVLQTALSNLAELIIK